MRAEQDKALARWLFVIAGLVAAMILIGGATRLTDSGLSITQWNFFKQIAPPLSQAGWEREFALYKQTTEFEQQNFAMTLGEFRYIYLWEWGHRFFGQLIGLAFALPFAFFLVAGRLRGRLLPIGGLFALGALQGAVGWWMVKSGLSGRLDVAPIRLALHLGIAFVIIGLAFWLAMRAAGFPKPGARRGAPAWAAAAFLGVLFVQIELGALLAGARAGKSYSDWPTIGGEWAPSTYFNMSPWWANMLENHAALQFDHRTLGYVVAVLALALGVRAMQAGQGPARRLGAALAVAALAQVGLGIAALVLHVPLHAALAHQAGAIVLALLGLSLLAAEKR